MEEVEVLDGAPPVGAPLLRSGSINSEGLTASTIALRKGLSRVENLNFELQGRVQETLSLSTDETAIMVDGQGNLRDELGFAIGASLSSSPPSRKSSERRSSLDDEEAAPRQSAPQPRLSQTSNFRYNLSNVRRQPKSAGEQQRQQWQDFQQQVGGTVSALTSSEVQRWRKNDMRIRSIGGGGFQADSGSDQSIRSDDTENIRPTDDSQGLLPRPKVVNVTEAKETRGSVFSRLFGRRIKSNGPSSEFIIEERSSSSSPMARLTRPGSITLFMKPTKARGKLLTHLIRTYGIPTELRAEVWIACSGAGEKMRQGSALEQYEVVLSKALETPSEHSAQIELDLHRTFPTNYVYQTDEGIASLRHVLLAYSARNPAVGYCQSMNFIVATLLLHMNERDAFWVLASIVEDLLPGYFSRDLIGVHVDQRTFTALVLARFPRVAQHLEQLQLPLAPVAYQWFMCMFVNSLPLSATLRVWDAFLHEGPKVIFRVALSIVKILQKDILAASSFQDAYEVLSEGTKDRERFSGARLMKFAFDPMVFGSFSSRMLLELRQRQLLFVRRELRLDEVHTSTNRSPSPPEECGSNGGELFTAASAAGESGPTRRQAGSGRDEDGSDKSGGGYLSTRPMKRDHSHAELTSDAFEWAFSPRPVLPITNDTKWMEGSGKRRRASTLRGLKGGEDDNVLSDASPLKSRALSFESSLKPTLPAVDMRTQGDLHGTRDESERVLGGITDDSATGADDEANEDDATIWDSDEYDEDLNDEDLNWSYGEPKSRRPDGAVILTHWRAGSYDGTNTRSTSPLRNIAADNDAKPVENEDEDDADARNAHIDEDGDNSDIPTIDLPAEFSTRLRSLSFVMSARQTGAAVAATAEWQHNALAQVPEEELLDIHEILERFDAAPKRRNQVSDEGINESSIVSNDDLASPVDESDPPRPIPEQPPKKKKSRMRRAILAPFSFLGGCVPA